MDNVTALFIRACKSLNPETRVRSVYRRFYGSTEPCNAQLAYLLCEIVQEYKLISTTGLIARLDPAHVYFYSNPYVPVEYADRCLIVMRSILRFASIDQIPDYPVARRYRAEEITQIPVSYKTPKGTPSPEYQPEP